MGQDRKEYMRAYNADPERKEQHKKESALRYETQEGRDYEYGKWRTVQSRYTRAKYQAAKRKLDFTLTIEEYTAEVAKSATHVIKK